MIPRPRGIATSHAGLTLVELVAVSALVVLLIAILTPSVRQARTITLLGVGGSNQRQIIHGPNSYASSHQRCPISINGTAGGRWTRPSRINEHTGPLGGDGRDGGWLGKYLRDRLPSVDIYYCPLAPGIADGAQQRKSGCSESEDVGTDKGFHPQAGMAVPCRAHGPGLASPGRAVTSHAIALARCRACLDPPCLRW